MGSDGTQKWSGPESGVGAAAGVMCARARAEAGPGTADLFDLFGDRQDQFVLVRTTNNLHADGQAFW